MFRVFFFALRYDSKFFFFLGGGKKDFDNLPSKNFRTLFLAPDLCPHLNLLEISRPVIHRKVATPGMLPGSKILPNLRKSLPPRMHIGQNPIRPVCAKDRPRGGGEGGGPEKGGNLPPPNNSLLHSFKCSCLNIFDLWRGFYYLEYDLISSASGGFMLKYFVKDNQKYFSPAAAFLKNVFIYHRL